MVFKGRQTGRQKQVYRKLIGDDRIAEKDVKFIYSVGTGLYNVPSAIVDDQNVGVTKENKKKKIILIYDESNFEWKSRDQPR